MNNLVKKDSIGGKQMNIDEYRALKAQMEKEKDQGAQPNAQTQPATTTNPASSAPQNAEAQQQAQPISEPQKETKPQEKEPLADQPITVEIDGQKLTLDELKNGYLRQSDYTRKTQELSRKVKEAEQAIQVLNQIKQNPEVAQHLAMTLNAPLLDPVQSRISDIENKYYDLLLQTELRNLHDKYGDFNDAEVLQIASSENISNLETAYQLHKIRQGGGASQTLDIDSIKQSLRDELLKELKSQQEAHVDTSTIIQTGGDIAPVQNPKPSLTPAQKKVARAMRMTDEEYMKWASIK